MQNISNWIEIVSGLNINAQNKILSSLLIIFILWLIRSIVLRVVWQRTENPHIRYHWQKGSVYLAAGLGIMLVGRVWFAGFQSLATYLGLVTAGLAIALQDLVKSFAGWMFILWRRPFVVGDRIQVGQFSGDVIDIRIFKFSLIEIGNWVEADQSTGRMIDVPNSMVISESIANYTRGFKFIWHEIPVLVTFESNWKKAKVILAQIGEKNAAHLTKEAERRVKEASKRYMIFYNVLTPMVYTTLRDSGVLLTIRYLIEPRKRRSSEQAIWEDILDEFAQCDDIDFAYPTQRFYNNMTEGKEKARAGNPINQEKEKGIK